LVRSLAHSAYTRLFRLLTTNCMHILEKATHYDIRLNGTNWDRFLDLSERPITVTPLTWFWVLFVETSDSGIRCGWLHVAAVQWKI